MFKLQHKVLLRMPTDLWAQIAALAVENRRSINSEIVWRLKKSVEGYSR